MNEPSPSRLFERIPSEEYLVERTEALRKTMPHEEKKETISLLVFQVGNELLAIETRFVKEVKKGKRVHHIPHRSGSMLLGLVNFNGVLQLCIALHRLLEIGTKLDVFKKMVAIEKEGDLWVFPVDEIEGILTLNRSDIENVPTNILKSAVNYLKGIFKIENKVVGLLDEELLFIGINRSLT